jgi:hypothetical protein
MTRLWYYESRFVIPYRLDSLKAGAVVTLRQPHAPVPRPVAAEGEAYLPPGRHAARYDKARQA